MTKRQHIAVALALTWLAGCAGASTEARTPLEVDSASAYTAPASDRVIALIVRETGAPQERVIPKARFVEDLGLDELDMIELVMALEVEFGLELMDEDFESLVTIADAIEYVQTHT